MITIDKIVRSRRKTVSLIIETDGSLTVRAPLRLGRAVIEQMVTEKAGWIRQRQEHLRQARRENPPHAYLPGEMFPYLGSVYPLEILDRAAPRLSFESGKFRLSAKVSAADAPKVFTAWYRQMARQVIAVRTQELARQFGYSYHSLRINAARTRWGSCGAKGTLNFTWRLVMAPQAAIDYVIIHELVHLKIKNHSRQFWEQVAAHLPDYRRQREWLKTNGHTLVL